MPHTVSLFPHLKIKQFVNQIVPTNSISEHPYLQHNCNFFACRLEELEANEKFMNTPHISDFFVVYFVQKGTIRQAHQIKTLTLEKNQIFFSKPGEVKTWNHIEDPTGFMLVFTQDFLLTAVDNKNLINTFDYLMANAQRKFMLGAYALGVYRTIFSEIHKEFHSPSKHGKDLIKFWIFVLLTKTNELYTDYSQKGEKKHASDTIKYTYNRFLTLLNESYAKLSKGEIQKPPKVKEYAKMLHVHPTYFGECIRKASGKSAKQIIDEHTMLLAKCQLLHTEQNVAEIAYALGFESSSYFIRFFRKYENVTPLEFKRSQRITA